MYAALKMIREEMLPKEGGKPPVRLFLLRTRFSSFVKELNEMGIVPVKSFHPRIMILSRE